MDENDFAGLLLGRRTFGVVGGVAVRSEAAVVHQVGDDSLGGVGGVSFAIG